MTAGGSDFSDKQSSRVESSRVDLSCPLSGPRVPLSSSSLLPKSVRGRASAERNVRFFSRVRRSKGTCGHAGAQSLRGPRRRRLKKKKKKKLPRVGNSAAPGPGFSVDPSAGSVGFRAAGRDGPSLRIGSPQLLFLLCVQCVCLCTLRLHGPRVDWTFPRARERFGTPPWFAKWVPLLVTRRSWGMR